LVYCGLAGVSPSRFSSYTVRYQPVISTCQRQTIADPAPTFLVLALAPLRRSRFFLSFSIEVEDQQLTINR